MEEKHKRKTTHKNMKSNGYSKRNLEKKSDKLVTSLTKILQTI